MKETSTDPLPLDATVAPKDEAARRGDPTGNGSGARPDLPPPTPAISLNGIEAAFIMKLESELRAAILNAQQQMNAQLAVVWAEKRVPDHATVTIHRTADGAPAALSWVHAAP